MKSGINYASKSSYVTINNTDSNKNKGQKKKIVTSQIILRFKKRVVQKVHRIAIMFSTQN